MTRPSIAAIMPVRNASNFLAASLGSILENLEHLDEVILVDDGSTDSSSKILHSWSKQSPKIQLLTTPGVGLVNSLNLAMSVVQSDFVARFDADDRYESNRISRQAEALSSDIVGVFCDYRIFSDSGRDLGFIPSPIFPIETAISLIRSQRTPHPGVMFNVEAVRSVGGYRSEDFPAEDLSLWLRLSKVGSLTSVPETLLSYRVSSKSISSSFSVEMRNRRIQLLDEIGLDERSVKQAVENLNSLNNVYQGHTHSEVRRILHLLELRAALNNTQFEGYSSKIANRALRVCLNRAAVKNLSQFTIETIRRRFEKRYLLK